MISCVDTSVKLDDIDIEAVDQIDVPAGTYQVPYTIEDFSELAKTYGATVSLVVVDSGNQSIPASGNTFTVQENEVYTVTIVLTLNGETKEKTITVTAVTVQTSSVLVSFDLQGGTGSFPAQTVAIGSFATRPAGDPTKEGYAFLGWYLSSQDETAFDFESMMVYHEITLIARWEEIVTGDFQVSYDLNGAIQTEAWREFVAANGFAEGPSIDPVYQGHLFQGWAYDPDGLVMFDFETTPITADLTLYAVWHIDFVVIVDDAAFGEASANDAFDLVNGDVLQQYELFANVTLTRLENDHAIDEDRVEYGVMLGSEASRLEYYNKNHVKIVGDLEPEQLDDAWMLTFRLITDNLVDEATYFYRFYLRYEQTIVYSDAREFQTLSVVANGTAVGLSGILSGGVYKIDNGTDVWRPAVYVSVLEGYEASLEGVVQTSFFTMYREGVRSIVTTDVQTGKRYLHVFQLDFQTPNVVLSLLSVQTVAGDASPTFRIVFPNEEFINYPTPAVGVLYSRTVPFLKLGLDGVSTHGATLDPTKSEFTVNNPIASSSDSVYVRAYATMNGKTSYSRYVYLLTKDTEGAYQVTKQIDMDYQRIMPSSSYSWSFGNTATVRVYQYKEGAWTYQSYQNSVEITGLGQYFVQMEGVDHIVDVVIDEDYPMPTGIENGMIYAYGVFAQIDAYNADWYYSFNGGAYEYLPSSVRFEQEGYYQVFVRSGYGYVEIDFTVTHQTPNN
jgi:uncharacterized repeat protein (TIGR02543 family)